MRKCILFIVFISFYTMCMGQGLKKVFLDYIHVKDDKISILFEHCRKRAPQKMKTFRVAIGQGEYKNHEKYEWVEFTGSPDSDDLCCDPDSYLGYTEIDGCTLYIRGDLKDYVKSSDKKTISITIATFPIEGGTAYSWTYHVKDGKAYYLGNINQE